VASGARAASGLDRDPVVHRQEEEGLPEPAVVQADQDAQTPFTVETGSKVRSPPPAGDQVNECHEERGPDDRPQDREGMPAEVDHEGLRQLELPGHPGPEEGPDEAEHDGDQKPAAGPTSERPSDGAADGRDDD